MEPNEELKNEESKKLDIKETPAPAPTAEELEKIAQDNIAELFGNTTAAAKPKEPKEEKKEQKPALEEKKAEPEEKPKKEEKPKEKPTQLAGIETGEKPEPVKVDRVRALDEEDLDAVADRVASRLKPEEEKKDEKEKPDPFAGFEGSDRTRLEALSFLSQNNARFKGRDLAKETIVFWNAEQDYISKWEKAHPGETFDPEDSEHADFYRKSEPAGITDEDIDDARIEMRVSERTKSIRQEVKKEAKDEIESRLAPIEREKLIQEKAPAIRQSVNTAIAEMVSDVVPGSVGDAGLTSDVLKKIETEDPVTFELLNSESAILNVRVRELESLRQLGEHFQFDEKKTVTVAGERLKPHADIIDTAMDIESAILALPDDQQVHDGKRFITREERAAKLQSIGKMNVGAEEKQRRIDTLEKNTWCIGIDDIREAFIVNSSNRVKKTLVIAEKKAGKNSSKNSQLEQKSKPAPDEQKTDVKAKTPPPAVTSSSEMVNTRVPGSSSGPSQAEINSNAFFP